jgi:hypothetical protein
MIIRFSLLIFFFTQFLASCGITYKVRNTNNELEELLYFPCGNVTIELQGIGNSRFILKQRFALSEKIHLLPDSLQVIYNGKVQPLKIFSMERRNIGSDLEISKNERFEFAFQLERRVFDGDTIAIYAPGFIKCREDFITLDTVFYTFANRLRIYGVNAL